MSGDSASVGEKAVQVYVDRLELEVHPLYPVCTLLSCFHTQRIDKLGVDMALQLNLCEIHQ